MLGSLTDNVLHATTKQDGQGGDEAFTGLLEHHGVTISMDGKGSYMNNLLVERLWRSLKHEEVYVRAYQDGMEARIRIGEHLRFYNIQRPHQALGYLTPAEGYLSSIKDVSQGNLVQSRTTLTSTEGSKTACPDLSFASILSN